MSPRTTASRVRAAAGVPLRTLSPAARRGAVFLLVVAVVVTLLAFKSQIKNHFRGGQTIQAEFAQNYGVVPHLSKVKVAGLQVGVVTGVEETDDDTVLVSMKVDDDAIDSLGSNPSARIAPLTILGGQYSVELRRGGEGDFDGDTIPIENTSTPVELDQVLEALPSDTRKATRGVISGANDNLGHGGTDGLRSLAEIAPRVVPPAGTFLEALQGHHPGHDLASIVTDLQNLAHVLDLRRAYVDGILGDLDTVSGTLASRDSEIASTISNLAGGLGATNDGLRRLNATLDRLDVVATDLRPTVDELDPLLDELQPTLREALPTVRKLPSTLRDARVVVRQLVPTSEVATRVVDELRGPVIDRINGPIVDYLAHTWHGKKGGPYSRSGGGIQADNKMYEELAYMIVNLDRSSMTQDAQGTLLNFQAGVGTSTLQPLALDEALALLVPQLNGGDL
jgi:phospholipid/cholesterol/gamma-HCH transport system substrate-binding protein